MRKAGFVFVVLLMAELGLALGQELPKPLPADDPHAAATADKNYPSAQYCANCHPTGLLNVISNAERYKILVSPDQPEKPGYLKIHQTAIQSDIIQKSQMCAPCHQVAVHAGIKLETVWEEWRASPAAKLGITCQ